MNGEQVEEREEANHKAVRENKSGDRN